MIRIQSSAPVFPGLSRTNPVYKGYFADPFVFSHAGTYFAVGTGPSCATGREFPMLRSSDLVHWEPLECALVRQEGAGPHFWAPEIAECGGTFYMYYSVGSGDERHELRVATCDRPEGPYHQLTQPVLDPESTPFAIDASPFRDDDGRWYLFYARDFLDSDGDSRPGTAIVVAPLIDMVRIPTEFTPVLRARHDWQRFQANRPIYGGVYDWHTIEGPSVVKHGERYYCFYSGGNWQNDSYGVDYVEANALTGPWIDTNPGSGPRVLQTVPGKLTGPGHNSVVLDDEGNPFIAYHAWDQAMTARQFCLDRLVWAQNGVECLRG